MNKARRKAIEELYERVQVLLAQTENLPDADDMKNEVETLRDEEQEYLDNMPEAMQNGDKGSAASEAVSQLETATDKLGEVADAITTLRDNLQEALDALDNAKAT
jgi:uncharacterized coiled-coil DUF342 family protein